MAASPSGDYALGDTHTERGAPMPNANDEIRPGIGLALSGGGFRATLFHCGALWRLNELGYLQKLARVSSVSGGSIAVAVAASSAFPPFLSPVALSVKPDAFEKTPGADLYDQREY